MSDGGLPSKKEVLSACHREKTLRWLFAGHREFFGHTAPVLSTRRDSEASRLLTATPFEVDVHFWPIADKSQDAYNCNELL